MQCNLIIDGNYILNKNVFVLDKIGKLYGELYKSLEVSTNKYKKLYNFNKIFFVSDLKEKSWRKDMMTDYKQQRKRDVDIDWEWVYQCYADYKSALKKELCVLEYPRIEGDDWISFLVKKANMNGESTIIVSNDYDIKQLMTYSLEPSYINIMINEMHFNNKVFIPKNYNVFFNYIENKPNTLFNMNNDINFIKTLCDFISLYKTEEIDNVKSLMMKMISGDKSDNIQSAFVQIKNDKKRGIGNRGAEKIYEDYINEYGDIERLDDNVFENMAYIICKRKRVSKNNIYDITTNIKNNNKLINLDIQNLPMNIVNMMNEEYKKVVK